MQVQDLEIVKNVLLKLHIVPEYVLHCARTISHKATRGSVKFGSAGRVHHSVVTDSKMVKLEIIGPELTLLEAQGGTYFITAQSSVPHENGLFLIQNVIVTPEANQAEVIKAMFEIVHTIPYRSLHS